VATVKSVLGPWSKSRLAFLAIGIVFVAVGVVSILQSH
jgi:hypothetical protein